MYAAVSVAEGAGVNRFYLSGRHLDAVRKYCVDTPKHDLHSIIVTTHANHVVKVDAIINRFVELPGDSPANNIDVKA